MSRKTKPHEIRPGWCWLRINPQRERIECSMAFVHAVRDGRVEFSWHYAQNAGRHFADVTEVNFYRHVPVPEEA